MIHAFNTIQRLILNLKKHSQKLGDYWQVFKHSMISKLTKKAMYMNDIKCTKTILYWQEATK